MVLALVQRLRDQWGQFSVLMFMKKNMAVTRKIPKTNNDLFWEPVCVCVCNYSDVSLMTLMYLEWRSILKG